MPTALPPVNAKLDRFRGLPTRWNDPSTPATQPPLAGVGAAKRNRTSDLLITSELLYRPELWRREGAQFRGRVGRRQHRPRHRAGWRR